MSNRLWGFLILILCIWSMYWIYQYFFIQNTYSFEISTNSEDYSVTLSHPKLPNNIIITCNEKKCNSPEIPAFSYSATVTAESYKNLNFKVNYPEDINKSFHFDLLKDTKLVSHTDDTSSITIPDPSDLEWKIHNKKESIQDKIVRLKIEKKSFFSQIDKNIWQIAFLEEWKNTALYIKNKKVANIELSKSDNISIIPIINEPEKLIISGYNKHFLWNNLVQELSSLEIELPIIYAKKYHSGLHLVTENWSFIQSDKKSDFTYFSYFEDFIELNNNFIGIIHKDDSRRKNNLNLTEYSGDIILLYNPKESIKKVLLTPSKNITKIFLSDKRILLEDSEKSIFELKNY